MGDAETVQQALGAGEVAVSDQTTDSGGGDTGEAGGSEAEGSEKGTQSQEQFYDVSGEKLTLKQLQEGYLRTSDYTRKTQELASQRDQLKPYQEMATYLQTNRDKAIAIERYLQGDKDALIEHLQGETDPIKQELYSLKAQNQQLQQGFYRMQTDRQMDDVNNDPKYNGLFKDKEYEAELLRNASYDRVPLKTAADRLFKLITKREVAAGQEAEKKITNNLNSPTRRTISSSRGTMNAPATSDPRKMTERQLHDEAMRIMGG